MGMPGILALHRGRGTGAPIKATHIGHNWTHVKFNVRARSRTTPGAHPEFGLIHYFAPTSRSPASFLPQPHET